MKTTKKSIFFAPAIGNTIEQYDTKIFTLLSFFIVSFFYQGTDLVESMSVFLFSVGLCNLAKPLGALFFGLYADIYGKKKTLVLSMQLITVSTIAISIVPSWFLGIYVVLALRGLQGFAYGCELAISTAYMYETSGAKSKNFGAIIPGVFAEFGVLMATLTIAFLFAVLDKSQLISWGWRIPFLIAAVGAFLSVYIRKSTPETKVFMKNSIENKNTFKNIIRESYNFAKNWKKNAHILFMLPAYYVPYSIVFSYFPIHTSIYHYQTTGRQLLLTSTMLVISIFASLFFARVADNVGRGRMILIGYVLLPIFCIPFICLVISGQNYPLFFWIFSCCLVSIPFSLTSLLGVEIMAIIPDLNRGTIATIFFSLSGILFSGMTPWLALKCHLINQSYGILGLFFVACTLAIPGAFKIYKKHSNNKAYLK